MLSKNQKFELELFIALPQKTHYPQGIEQKSFQGEIIKINVPIKSVSETLFHGVGYRAILLMHIFNHA